MKKLSLIFLCVFASLRPCVAANVFLRNNAVTNSPPSDNTGHDWANAITNFTGAAGSTVRTNDYWLDHENWWAGSFWRWDAPVTGSTVATIHFASVANHGTNAGWSDSFATNSAAGTNVPATFYGWIFDTSNWRVTGDYGQWETNFSDYIPYGAECAGTNISDNLFSVSLNAGVTNVTFEHVRGHDLNIKGQTNPPWREYYACFYEKSGNGWITNRYCSWYYVAGTSIQANAHDSLYEYCVLGANGIAQITMGFTNVDHTELCAHDTANNVIWHGDRFLNARSSAWHFYINPCTNFFYIGCSFIYTGFWNVGVEVTDSTFLIDGNTSPPSDYIYLVNCTFFNIPYGNAIGSTSGFSASNHCYRKNCLVINDTRIDSNPFDYSKRWSNIDHNSYFASGSQSEAGIENLPSNILKNGGIYDVRLASDTAARDSSLDSSLPAAYLTDQAGVPFTTSRGAFQFVPQPSTGVILK